MKTASGKVRSENKWPLPVVVRPRGVREILWTLAVFIAPMVSFEMAGGAYVFLNFACVAYLLRPSKRALIKVMGYCFTICLLWSAFRGGFSEYLQQLLDAIRWSQGSDDSFWGFLLRIFIVATNLAQLRVTANFLCLALKRRSGIVLTTMAGLVAAAKL